MATLMRASNEWANRPADQRFVSLDDLNKSMKAIKQSSVDMVGSLKNVRAVSNEADNGLYLVAGDNAPSTITNYAFGQMSRAIGNGRPFPPSYIQSLPAHLAAENINYGISQLADEDARFKFLFTKPDDEENLNIRSLTSESYGRIWNYQISDALVKRFGNGIDGEFTVPGEFGKAVKVTKANTTIFGGDRSMFVFLCDEKHKIELPNRRNGETGALSRGFFVWNSEVGDTTLGVATFLFDYVCSNRIVWGAEGYREIKLRHSLKAPERFLDEVSPMLTQMTHEAAAPTEQLLIAAQGTKISDESDADKRTDDMLKFFNKHLSIVPRTAKAINETHMKEEGRPIETLWDVTTAITAHAKAIPYQGERVELEKLGGKVLDLVANK